MRFCTAINCMDGRVQQPVIDYLRRRFRVEYIDLITEAGPNLILSKQEDKTAIESILVRVKISVEKHKSVGIAVIGHHDCAGNPAPREEQIQHLHNAVQFLSQQYEIPVIALWVDEKWQVNEIDY